MQRSTQNTSTTYAASLYAEFSETHQQYIATKNETYLKTPIFFTGKKREYLEAKSVIQFGFGVGSFFTQSPQNSWSVIGYEYSKIAVDFLAKQKNPLWTIREQNLNALDAEKKLTYRDQLKKDLELAPANILAIHILEFLDDEAILQLCFNMIFFAKSGSTFFIRHQIYDEKEIAKEDIGANRLISKPQLLKLFSVSSLFYNAKNIETLYHAQENFADVDNKNIIKTETYIAKKL